MAIYHLAVKVIGRSRNQSAIAAAAYRSGERLVDEETGEAKHYRARLERIRFTGIFAPPESPAWTQDRNSLWNKAQQAERRKDATLAREIVLALPHELTDTQRLWLVQDFVREAFVRRGLVADVAIHAPDGSSDARNHHAHILIAERQIGRDGFAAMKDRASYSKATLGDWRRRWGQLSNRHLARYGIAALVDHRTLVAQGINRTPNRHRGNVATQRLRRTDELRQVQAKAARETTRRSAVPRAFRLAVAGVTTRAASVLPVVRMPVLADERREEGVFKNSSPKPHWTNSARAEPVPPRSRAIIEDGAPSWSLSGACELVMRLRPSPIRITELGQFRAASRLIGAPMTIPRAEAFGQAMRPTVWHEPSVWEEIGPGGGGDDGGLGALLDAIADEVHGRTACIAACIKAEYAGKIRNARKTLPPDQAAGMVRALRQMKAAAIKAVRESAALEIKGRQKVARVRWGRHHMRKERHVSPVDQKGPNA